MYGGIAKEPDDVSLGVGHLQRSTITGDDSDLDDDGDFLFIYSSACS